VLSARRDQRGNLYAIRADGGGLKRLTNYTAPKTVIAGSFSPDGNFITFARFTNGPDPAIFVMRADGSGVRQVTPRGAKGTGFASDWGPAR
jgi:Tol biopolymer transport system component